MAAADAVLENLAKVATARAAAGDDAVAGVRARWVVAPASTDEVSEVLRLASQHDLTVVPRGAGTKLGWGSPPRSVDVVLDLTGIRGVVEHAAGDLVVVVRAGTPLAELQDTVATAGQQLALDSSLAGATVGGVLATDTSGPRRVLYGTARDLLIGVTFIRADGVIAHAGGKVVKNVAGYDFGKLLTGSYGTLGVITEAVFRLHPRPVAHRFVSARLPDAVSAGHAALAVLGSQLVPSAVEVDQGPDGGVTVTVLVEGVAAGLPERVAAARAHLGADTEDSEDPPEGFGSYPFSADGIGLKVTSSLTGVGPVLTAARRATETHGLPVRVRGSAAGVFYAGLPADSDPIPVGLLVDALREVATPYGGSVTVLSAPAQIHSVVDVWGPVGGLDLMRRLKQEMDPDHRLSPGRFVGGI